MTKKPAAGPAARPAVRPAVRPMSKMLAWIIPVIAVAILGGYLAGKSTGSREPTGAVASTPGGNDASFSAVDLASMSPQERASRLYDRVMRDGETGHVDSARIYAPMALQAYAALGPPDAHSRYDVGMIWAVVGDSSKARAEATNILNERPTHLLGLLLAMRTAATPQLRATYERRFVAAAKTELPNAVPEYDEHRHDIDFGLRAAQAAKK
ncbi:MAG TPA: hypothetical protein VF368_03250 [Gemmatimonadaceae bacterium]